MASQANQEKAVGVLQQLGLKEYEAKCFVALSRVPNGTAKDVSEITDVPRTRVYDAIRVLEAQGLVEIQHGSPQKFRAVPVREAIETLRHQYESRVDTLQDALTDIDPVDTDEGTSAHEVWALTGGSAIANRTRQLVDDADEEVVMVVGSDELLTDDLVAALTGLDPSIDVILGALTEPTEDRLESGVPNARTFVSGLEWLRGGNDQEADTAIGLLLLVDRGTILVSTVDPETGREQAVFGRGFGNGLVVIARRLMATGLLSRDDPGR